MPEVRLLEESAVDLAQIELVLRRLHMDLVLLRGVCSGPHLVVAAASVSGRRQLAGRDTRCHGVGNDCVVLVLR